MANRLLALAGKHDEVLEINRRQHSADQGNHVWDGGAGRTRAGSGW